MRSPSGSAGPRTRGPAGLILMLAGVATAACCAFAAGRARQPDLPPLRPDDARAAALELRLTQRLSEAPADAQAWCGLAYVQQASESDGAAARASLARCYEVSPLSPDLSAWRVRMALDHWGALTPELRGQVRADALALWNRPDRRRELLAALGQASDPAGAMAGRLLTAELWADYRRRVRARTS